MREWGRALISKIDCLTEFTSGTYDVIKRPKEFPSRRSRLRAPIKIETSFEEGHIYRSNGPTISLHVDGYDERKLFMLYVRGAKDGFSRRMTLRRRSDDPRRFTLCCWTLLVACNKLFLRKSRKAKGIVL